MRQLSAHETSWPPCPPAGAPPAARGGEAVGETNSQTPRAPTEGRLCGAPFLRAVVSAVGVQVRVGEKYCPEDDTSLGPCLGTCGSLCLCRAVLSQLHLADGPTTPGFRKFTRNGGLGGGDAEGKAAGSQVSSFLGLETWTSVCFYIAIPAEVLILILKSTRSDTDIAGNSVLGNSTCHAGRSTFARMCCPFPGMLCQGLAAHFGVAESLEPARKGRGTVVPGVLQANVPLTVPSWWGGAGCSARLGAVCCYIPPGTGQLN